jgi:hypothetical protein
MADAEFPRRGVKYNVQLGTSLHSRSRSRCHTLRFSFKPTSCSTAKRRGRISIEDEKAGVSLPTSNGADVTFSGKAEAHKKTEFLLLCSADGTWRLEKMGRNIKNLQLQRSEHAMVTPTAAGRATAVGDEDDDAGDEDEESILESDLFGDEDD